MESVFIGKESRLLFANESYRFVGFFYELQGYAIFENDKGEEIWVMFPGVHRSTLLPVKKVGENEFELSEEVYKDNGKPPFLECQGGGNWSVEY